MPPDGGAPGGAGRGAGGVLFVHAHPDDEAVSSGGLIARLVDAGVRVDLVTCTDGAEGEIHDPELDAAEAQPRLAEIRAAELACALDALGGGAVRHHKLGYRDSGMMGTAANEHPDSLWKADLNRATERLVSIVRAARPSAIVTYDENGNYGHPDHINANRIAAAAFDAVADVDRFYEIAFAREPWMRLMEDMKARGIPLPWGQGEDASPSSDAGDAASVVDAADAAPDAAPSTEEQAEWGTPEALVTTRIEVVGWLDRKRRCMECHRTQRQDMGWLLELPEDLALRALGTEHFVLRQRRSSPIPEGYREDWVL
jgi:LmbE family N-acetylglucosaminyl deacetylase